MRQNNIKHMAYTSFASKSFANSWFVSYSVQRQLGEINDDISV